MQAHMLPRSALQKAALTRSASKLIHQSSLVPLQNAPRTIASLPSSLHKLRHLTSSSSHAAGCHEVLLKSHFSATAITSNPDTVSKSFVDLRLGFYHLPDVFFPGRMLPLFISQPRYKSMIQEAQKSRGGYFGFTSFDAPVDPACFSPLVPQDPAVYCGDLDGVEASDFDLNNLAAAQENSDSVDGLSRDSHINASIRTRHFDTEHDELDHDSAAEEHSNEFPNHGNVVSGNAAMTSTAAAVRPAPIPASLPQSTSTGCMMKIQNCETLRDGRLLVHTTAVSRIQLVNRKLSDTGFLTANIRELVDSTFETPEQLAHALRLCEILRETLIIRMAQHHPMTPVSRLNKQIVTFLTNFKIDKDSLYNFSMQSATVVALANNTPTYKQQKWLESRDVVWRLNSLLTDVEESMVQ